MSKISLTLPNIPVTGKQVSFIAPCGSDTAECITINKDDYVICDAKGNNIAGTAGIWASGAIVSIIVDVDTHMAYIQNPATPVGQKTEGGGEIFGDYANNKAEGLYSAAFGTSIYRAYDKNEDVPVNPPYSDLRHCKAVGTGSMASGMGAIAYSRASKSLGYRTQTGYPSSQEELDKRPEAVCLSVDLADPTEYSPTKDLSEIDDEYSNMDTVLFTADSVTLKIYDKMFDIADNGYKSYVIYDIPTTVSDVEWKLTGKTKVVLNDGEYSSMADSYILKGKIRLTLLDSDMNILASELIRNAADYFEKYWVDEEEESYEYSLTDEVSIEKSFTAPVNTSYIKIEAVGFSSDDDGGYIYDFVLSDLTLTGFATENVGQASVAIGADTAALGNHSFASGHESVARGLDAVAFGKASKAYGNYSLSGGFFAKAIGDGSIAFGYYSEAIGEYSVALGRQCEATGTRSFAIGNKAKAANTNSFAVGASSEANGSCSIALGYAVKANGVNSVAMNTACNAEVESSSAFGHWNTLPVHKKVDENGNVVLDKDGNETILTPKGQMVVGKFNAYQNNETLNALFVVGNGTKSSKRSNAFIVNQDGSIIVSKGCYGTKLPTTGVAGQIFFLKKS